MFLQRTLSLMLYFLVIVRTQICTKISCTGKREARWEICIAQLWNPLLDMDLFFKKANRYLAGIKKWLSLGQEMCAHCSATMNLVRNFLKAASSFSIHLQAPTGGAHGVYSSLQGVSRSERRRQTITTFCCCKKRFNRELSDWTKSRLSAVKAIKRSEAETCSFICRQTVAAIGEVCCRVIWRVFQTMFIIYFLIKCENLVVFFIYKFTQLGSENCNQYHLRYALSLWNTD